MHTQNNGSNMQMSSVTSLAQNLLFFLLNVFHSMSSNPLNKRGPLWLLMSPLEVVKQLHFEKSFPEDISFLRFF